MGLILPVANDKCSGMLKLSAEGTSWQYLLIKPLAKLPLTLKKDAPTHNLQAHKILQMSGSLCYAIFSQTIVLQALRQCLQQDNCWIALDPFRRLTRRASFLRATSRPLPPAAGPGLGVGLPSWS